MNRCRIMASCEMERFSTIERLESQLHLYTFVFSARKFCLAHRSIDTDFIILHLVDVSALEFQSGFQLRNLHLDM